MLKLKKRISFYFLEIHPVLHSSVVFHLDAASYSIHTTGFELSLIK